MTLHRLVMRRNARIFKEVVHQTVGAQPVSCNLARDKPDFSQKLRNYRNISVAAIAASLGDAGRRHLIVIIAKKAPIVNIRLKKRESSSGATEELLVKSVPTVSALRKLVL